jgi:hypothetical protein
MYILIFIDENQFLVKARVQINKPVESFVFIILLGWAVPKAE